MKDDPNEPSDFDWGGADLQEDSDVGIDIVRFTTRGQGFAIEATTVREIVALAVDGNDVGVEVVALPGLEAPIRGVAMLRRQAVAVIDLAQWLGLEGAGHSSDFAPRILVVEHDGLVAGLLTENVNGFESWTQSDADAHASLSPTIQELATAARWAPGGVLALLDVSRIMPKVAVR